MEIRSYRLEGVLVIEVGGTLDALTVHHFQTEVTALAAEGDGPVVLDLSRLDEVYSVGLAALPMVARQVGRTRRVIFCGIRPAFRELMRITMVDRQLATCQGLQEAIDLVQADPRGES